MGRSVDASLLLGSREVAERLGLRRYQHVHWFREHDPTFPEPVTRIGTGRGTLIWYWPDVEKWAKQAGRLQEPL